MNTFDCPYCKASYEASSLNTYLMHLNTHKQVQDMVRKVEERLAGGSVWITESFDYITSQQMLDAEEIVVDGDARIVALRLQSLEEFRLRQKKARLDYI